MLLLSSIRANDHLFGKLRILDEWLFHMKFMKRAFGEFRKFHKMTTSVGFCLSYDPLKPDFFPSEMSFISIRKCIRTLSIPLRILDKVLLHVWSYDF